MLDDFKKLLSIFNAQKVKYLIVGGYAVSFHAQPHARGRLSNVEASPSLPSTRSGTPSESRGVSEVEGRAFWIAAGSRCAISAPRVSAVRSTDWAVTSKPARTFIGSRP